MDSSDSRSRSTYGDGQDLSHGSGVCFLRAFFE